MMLGAFAIAQHLGHLGPARLLHGAQGFLLQGRHPAGDIAGGGVLAHRLAVIEEVGFEVVDHRGDVLEHRAAGGAGHEQPLGAEDLRNLGEDRRAAGVADLVGDPPHQGVGREPREAVRAAALQPHHQVGDRAGDADVPFGDGHQFRHGGQTLLDLVAGLLGGEGPQAFAVQVRGLLQQGGELVALAAQAQDQRAAGIGMGGQGRDHGAGGGEVAAELGAAEGVGEGVDPVHPALEAFVGGRRDLLGGAGDAAHGAEDPDLVAGAHPAVPAAIALEGGRLRRVPGLGGDGGVGVVLAAGEQGRQVVAVHMVARRDGRRGLADRPAVFADLLAHGDVAQGDLVPGFDIGSGDDPVAHGVARRQRPDRHGHIIARIDLQDGERGGHGALQSRA